MTGEFSEDVAIRNKSLALIRKTRAQLAQVDGGKFPTPSSEDARQLLLDVLKALEEPDMLAPMDPQVLHNRLIDLHRLVRDVEASSCDQISWPLVNYCDEIWSSLVTGNDHRIFYSLTDEHNYGISPFTVRVARSLDCLLPSQKVAEIVGGTQIFCLHLASLEDTNLPLYANIGHEFGHVVFSLMEQELVKVWLQEIRPALAAMWSHLDGIGKTSAARRKKRLLSVLFCFAKELVADQVGALVFGPAFYLSLYEMAWGNNRDAWTVRLDPIDDATKAYPSANFRLRCVRRSAEVDAFAQGLPDAVPALLPKRLRQAIADLASFSGTCNGGAVVVQPHSDSDCKAMQEVIAAGLGAMEEKLAAFLQHADEQIRARYDRSVARVGNADVAKLLHRLEDDILPNIVREEGELLGEPASFQAILTASAVYRIYLLSDAGVPAASTSVYQDIQKLERLTAKALEVSYVQRDFNRNHPAQARETRHEHPQS